MSRMIAAAPRAAGFHLDPRAGFHARYALRLAARLLVFSVVSLLALSAVIGIRFLAFLH